MAAGGKQDSAAYEKLKKDLAAGTAGSLYLFYGEEVYLRDHYLGELRRALVPEGMEAFNHHRFGEKKLSMQSLFEAVDALPMMSERTLVEVWDYDPFKAGEADREALLHILSDLPDFCCLVFVFDAVPYKSDGRTKLGAYLRDHAQAVRFAEQAKGDLVRWIRRRFAAVGREIGGAEAEYLIFYCGALMTNLVSQIGKIGAYAKGRAVTRGDIEAVADPVLEARVFALTDAVMAEDFDRAASVLGDLLRMQEEPIMLLAVLGRQLRQLYSARLAVEAGKGAPYLMKLWDMRSSYAAQTLLRGAKRRTLPWCRRAVRRCAETDLAMKSTGQDSAALLTALLAELSA
ncbi:MAG TPA: DNA polymerase III subunit delta [Oscillospiraceae bacterium]|nr:DNA polymerase III subunit delta [Oscillospiraceae bacterium]